jgi:hypothetical protein
LRLHSHFAEFGKLRLRHIRSRALGAQPHAKGLGPTQINIAHAAAPVGC